jgi:hypothetical protein
MSTIMTLAERVSYHFTDPTPTTAVILLGWVIAFASTSLVVSATSPK